MSNTQTILRIDSSARKTGSKSRALTDTLVNVLSSDETKTNVVTRDLTDGIGLYNETWVGATFTPIEDRSDEQKESLAESDTIVAELQSADVLILGAPMYNFNIAASLKAWLDLTARAGVTFHYTEDGPVGLLKGIKTYIVFSSGGSPLGSDLDFGTGYLKHFLSFIGITDVTIVSSEEEIFALRNEISVAA